MAQQWFICAKKIQTADRSIAFLRSRTEESPGNIEHHTS